MTDAVWTHLTDGQRSRDHRCVNVCVCPVYRATPAALGVGGAERNAAVKKTLIYFLLNNPSSVVSIEISCMKQAALAVFRGTESFGKGVSFIYRLLSRKWGDSLKKHSKYSLVMTQVLTSSSASCWLQLKTRIPVWPPQWTHFSTSVSQVVAVCCVNKSPSCTSYE